jgi:transcriptional regulator with XRE-family HTH domain
MEIFSPISSILTIMKISNLLSDDSVLTELGRRMVDRRIGLQLTQAELAERAGVSKRTVERIESGASAQMAGVIRILRALEILPGLDLMLPETTPRPTDLLKRKGKARLRASSRGASQATEEPWVWKDDA